MNEQLGNAKVPVQTTAAQNAIENADGIANRAERIASEVEERLSRVMREHSPQVAGEGCDRECLPPYFNEMRDKHDCINNALDRISMCLDRLEF